MFKPSATRPPVTIEADPTVYHAPQKGRRGTREFVMSRSQLEDFAGCPRKWMKGIPDDPSKAMRWGSLSDVITLTPKLFEKIYAVAGETYTTTGMQCPKCKSITDAKACRNCKCERVEIKIEKPWDWKSNTCSEWREAREKEGKICIRADEASDAWAANARLKEDDQITAIFENSDKQVLVNVDWHDKDTGLIIPFKCLLDIVPRPKSKFGDTLYDYKTTVNAAVKQWTSRVFNDRLWYQAGLYVDAMNAAAGTKYENFGHVIQESSAPYEPVDRLLEFEWLTMGRFEYKRDLAHYCKCLMTGKWPRYNDELVQMASWMLREA